MRLIIIAILSIALLDSLIIYLSTVTRANSSVIKEEDLIAKRGLSVSQATIKEATLKKLTLEKLALTRIQKEEFNSINRNYHQQKKTLLQQRKKLSKKEYQIRFKQFKKQYLHNLSEILNSEQFEHYHKKQQQKRLARIQHLKHRLQHHDLKDKVLLSN